MNHLADLRVLVSGAGGDIGQSIGKILREEKCQTFGVDIDINTPAQFIFDDFSPSIKCTDPAFTDFLFHIIKEHRIDCYIPVAEAELRFLMYHPELVERIAQQVKLVLPNSQSMRIGFDKLETALLLEREGLPSPQTYSAVSFDFSKLAPPFILKSRFGAGGKGLYNVEDITDWKYLRHKLDLSNYIVQELIGTTEEEYTCGLFRSVNGETRTIVFKRKLNGGYSSFGTVVEQSEIEVLLEKVAKILELNGSINIQLRLENGVPYIFEINPRFSSTVYFRKLFGFEDVLWSIQDGYQWQLADYHLRSDINYFYKGYSEYVK